MNLKNKNYVRLIFGDELNIATKFSEIDIETVRKKITEIKIEKCYSSRKIKKLIRKKDFLFKLTNAFEIQAHYANVG